MVEGMAGMSGSELLGVIDAALDALADDRHRLAPDSEQLELLTESLRVEARFKAWQAGLAGRVEDGEVAWREHGTSTSTWLTDVGKLTPREARRLIGQGQHLQRFTIIGDAARAGRVLPGQVDAICETLAKLPDDLPTSTITQAQELMVGFAGSHTAVELRKLSGRLLELVAPEVAEASEAERVEREYRAALRNRELTFTDDHHGSVLIKGSLPTVAAEPLVRIVNAYAAAAARGTEVLDPDAERLTPKMRRADALLALVNSHQQQALAPSHGGDRPRIVVTMTLDSLVKTATDAGLLADGLATAACGRLPAGRLVGTGDRVPAGVLRQLLCDADLLPIVLGGPSQILDVGRTQRLVTPAIRAALEARDQGCVFPGCDRPPQDCHAHHVQPWRLGGITAVDSLILVCPHHHGIVEPGHDPTADRWKVRFRADGVPEFLPPKRTGRPPQVHARFHTLDD